MREVGITRIKISVSVSLSSQSDKRMGTGSRRQSPASVSQRQQQQQQASTPGEEGSLSLEGLSEGVADVAQHGRPRGEAVDAATSLHHDSRHLDQVDRRLAFLQSLSQVQDLSSHDGHLPLKQVPIKASIRLEQVVQLSAQLLHEVHVRQEGQHEVSDLR